ncbi:hypothetical protein SISSUDRAFT_1020449 [Sistotremastrum suecicum HHB10207 ss-3]|uniref:BTB domain-containing protein n=1 Tax=Sistotremastrum suecicum HHB10207 ss-3 TaxID=1314776 RepID=A0A166E602_9AGAM|nr:hypothetical protein SISSUDRAFT_1020449 [Sistotremastrum suecicum HHB10207 ss-3]
MAPTLVSPAPGVSFVLRPFPPPHLVGVPVDYIVAQLHKLAQAYWDKPETADCTLIVPLSSAFKARPTRPDPRAPRPSTSNALKNQNPLQTGPFAFPGQDSYLGRRGSAPVTGEGVRRRLVLHRDYLSSQSTFLQTVFVGASPFDLAARPRPLTSQLAAGAFPVPPQCHPRLLPCAPNHPQVYLPVPDPDSFPHLIHYLYFGKTDYIEECLNDGSIKWESIVRNVEYLGLRDDIKVFLGRWWGTWLDPASRMRKGTAVVQAVDDDSDGGDGGDEAEDEDRLAIRIRPRPRTRPDESP